MPWYVFTYFSFITQLNLVKLGSYILLASLSQKCKFSSSALKAIVGAMASAAHTVRGDQFVNSLVAVCEPQEALDAFSSETLKAIVRTPYVNAFVCYDLH